MAQVIYSHKLRLSAIHSIFPSDLTTDQRVDGVEASYCRGTLQIPTRGLTGTNMEVSGRHMLHVKRLI